MVLRFASVTLALWIPVVSACGSSAQNAPPASAPPEARAESSGGSTPVAPTASTTRQMSSTEWDALRTSGAFTAEELPAVGERQQVSMAHSEPRGAAPAGTVRLRSCMPGGSSEGIVAERATGALWMIRTVGGLTIPRGVNISATRCFEENRRLPEGRTLAGVIVVSYPSHIEP